jgi:hypothetical protein
MHAAFWSGQIMTIKLNANKTVHDACRQICLNLLRRIMRCRC